MQLQCKYDYTFICDRSSAHKLSINKYQHIHIWIHRSFFVFFLLQRIARITFIAAFCVLAEVRNVFYIFFLSENEFFSLKISSGMRCKLDVFVLSKSCPIWLNIKRAHTQVVWKCQKHNIPRKYKSLFRSKMWPSISTLNVTDFLLNLVRLDW